MVSVGTTHCSWYFRGLILGPGFSDVGQRPHLVSTEKNHIERFCFKSGADPKLLKTYGFLSPELHSSRSGLLLVIPVSVSIGDGPEMHVWLQLPSVE